VLVKYGASARTSSGVNVSGANMPNYSTREYNRNMVQIFGKDT
jgi:hypothetical protein